MGFDLQNFGIGLLTGWASAYGVYRYRHIVKGIAESLRSQATTAQNAATRSADSRLMGDLVRRCETSHLAGAFIKLTDVLVEPRFLAAPPLAAPPDDDVLEDVFHVVPRIHDLPYLHAAFNIPSLTITDLSEGSRALALLGLPGSGRTTALHAIALYSLNRVRFQTPADTVNALIEEEEAKLPEKERAKRVQERLKMEMQAREKLAEERGITFETRDDAAKERVPLFNRLMPLYISFEYFDLDDFGRGEVDPAEPLVRAVQASVGGVTAMTMPGNVYERLSEGKVLLLLDGLDELSTDDQRRATAWLEAFLAQYSSNFIIVAGPVQGYGALSALGLTPIYLRPWQDYDVQQAVDQWAKALPRFTSRKISGARKVTDEAREAARANIRALPTFDLIVKIWATLSEDEPPAQMSDWYSLVLERFVPAKLRTPATQQSLVELGQLQLEEGVIRRSRMIELGIGGVAPAPAPGDTADVLREAMEPTGRRAAKAAQSAASSAAKQIASPQDKLLSMLCKSGMLVALGEGRYRFRHPRIAAYYASFGLGNAAGDVLVERAAKPAWHAAIGYAAMHTSIDALVHTRLQTPTDLLTTALTDAAAWLRYAPDDAVWRGQVLKRLADIMVYPNQYPLTRERAAAALVTSGDKSILFILRKAARNQNASIRRLACLAMGALGDPAAIADLRSLVQDTQSEVQLAAAMSLGAIATEDALEAMVIAFTQDTETVRKAIAEAFAALPEAGHPILYDANRDDDMLLRRVSIAGIRRIRAGWALAAIYRTFLQDSEWYVKSAAEAAFAEVQGENAQKPQSYPSAEGVPWLQEWARKRGEVIVEGDGLRLLDAALRDSEPAARALAAETVGQLGLQEMLPTLYEKLIDASEDVRAAAYRGLAALQLQVGRSLPLPG